MDKKKFERQLSDIQKRGSFTLNYIERLFNEDRKSLFNNEKLETLISDNFPIMMRLAGRGNIDSLINTLYNHDTMKPFFEKNETIKYILDNIQYDDFELVINDSSIKQQAQNFIHENFDYILENYPTNKIVPIYEYMDLDEHELKKIDKYFSNRKQELFSEILTKTLSLKGNVDKNQLQTLLEIVTKIVDRVLKKENCKITDIQILMSGAFSNVLRIGDTIIKVGIPRKTYNIPNDKRILQPHIRKDLRDEFGIEATIEVSDRVDTDISLSEDQLYAIYKDMRDRGIVCADFKYDNIGKLLKPNTPRNNTSTGLTGEIFETLNPGDYVLIDTDFIYKENDPNLNLSSDLSSKFESRYKKEQAKKVGR